MKKQTALWKKRSAFLLICSVFLFFCAAGDLRSTADAAARQHPKIKASNAAPLQAEYEVIVLPSPLMSDSTGQGVGVGQSVGTGRIAGAPRPDETHAIVWPQGSSVGVDLHPQDFRYSAALDTDGQRQVGHGNGPPTAFQRHALVWFGSAASYVDLHPTGNWTDSIARAIAGDQQVGNINYYFYTTYERIIIEHAALWRGSAASVVDLHPSGGGCDRSYANDTDGSRQVGYGYFDSPNTMSPYRALLWSGTAASAVVLHPSGFTHSFAEGISGDEQVGYAFNTLQGDGYSRALLWRGTAASVVSLHPAGYLATTALATNGTHQVGFGGPPESPYQSHALRWSGTAQSVLDLHALLPPEFSLGSIAYDIDAEGNIVGLAQRADGSTSAVLWRRVSAPPINLAPQVQLISPTSRGTFGNGKAIQLIVRASDQDGQVMQVTFYADDELIGTVSHASADGTYRYSWRVPATSATKYHLRAQALDNQGMSATSRTVTVTIAP